MVLNKKTKNLVKANDQNIFDIDELRALARGQRATLAKRCAQQGDILGWGRAVMPHKFYLPFCAELHGYFVDIRKEPLTGTEAPRDHAKTAIKCVLIPLYQALEEPQAFDHYLNVQSTGDKATAVNVAIKHELENNIVLRELYGDQVSKEKWTESQLALKNGVVFSSISAGQSIRGVNYLNRRPSYIIVDDLYDDSDINNPLSTEAKSQWFWSALYPAISESRKSSVHVQGTAINQSDLLYQWKSTPGVKYRTFASVTDWDKGIVLWPELKSFDERKAQRALMPSVIFAREFQNERRDDASSIVKRAWLQGWEYDPTTLDLERPGHKLAAVLLSIDPSIGEKRQNDYSAFALILVTQWADSRGVEFWIEELYNEHLTLNERILKMQAIADSRPAKRKLTKILIEAIAGFKDFAAEARRRTTLPIQTIEVVKDKISNLESKSHFFEQHKVHISNRISKDRRDELEYQLTTNYPKFDDLRDAVLLALDHKVGTIWNFV